MRESGIDLITILRCFLSFKTVVMSRNIIVFRITVPDQKAAIRVVHASKYLVQLTALVHSAHSGAQDARSHGMLLASLRGELLENQNSITMLAY